MNYPIGRFDAGLDHVRIVDLHTVFGVNPQCLAMNRPNRLQLDGLTGRDSSRHNVVGQDCLECRLILRLK